MSPLRRTGADVHAKFLAANPEAKFWIDIGLPPRPAKGLCTAGILGLEQIEGMSRQDLLKIWGVGELSLHIIEEALGHLIPSSFEYWRKKGIPRLAARVFVREGIKTIEQLRSMTREQLLALAGMGPHLLTKVEERLEIRFHSPLSYWMDRGLRKKTAATLNAEGIFTLEQLAAAPRSDLIKMFTIIEYMSVEVVLRQIETAGEL